MRCSLRDCLICRCPPDSVTYAKNWSQDATNQTHNSSRHRIIDYGVGLLAGLVETQSRIPAESLLVRELEIKKYSIATFDC